MRKKDTSGRKCYLDINLGWNIAKVGKKVNKCMVHKCVSTRDYSTCACAKILNILDHVRWNYAINPSIAIDSSYLLEIYKI